MNRIIIVGNGFDLAHGVKTKYEDFIEWYWIKRIENLKFEHTNESDDGLCKLVINSNRSWKGVYYDAIYDGLSDNDILYNIFSDKNKYEITYPSKLFEEITKSIENKGWVDIENEYYKLLVSLEKEQIKNINKDLNIIKKYLSEYLNITQKNISESIVKDEIKQILFEPILAKDVAISSLDVFCSIIKNRREYKEKELIDIIEDYKIDKTIYHLEYDINHINDVNHVNDHIENDEFIKDVLANFPKELFLPDRIMLLNFNYTSIADKYFPEKSDRFYVNHIHGSLDDPDSIIFGYGDEDDEMFNDLKKTNDNEYLNNIKTIKYLDSPKYNELLALIESAPYQIYIMGHSCGKSDGTMLNTLFEHRNCISIKPFYYKKGDGTDNYTEMIQNIYRNFKDMKLMRARVVNKKQCKPLPQS